MSFCEKCVHYKKCLKRYEEMNPNDFLTFFPHNEDCPLFKTKDGECIHKDCEHFEVCNAWIRHGLALYEDFDYSVGECPYYRRTRIKNDFKVEIDLKKREKQRKREKNGG